MAIISLPGMFWKLNIKGMKSKDKLIEWHILSLPPNEMSVTLMSPVRSGLLYANMWVRSKKRDERFSTKFLSLPFLEAVCLKGWNLLTNPLVIYMTVVKTGFEFPMQFLIYVVFIVSHYTKSNSPLFFHSEPILVYFLHIFLKTYLYSRCKLLQNLTV